MTRANLSALVTLIALANPALASNQITATINGSFVNVVTDNNAMVVFSTGNTNGITRRADSSGHLSVPLSAVPGVSGQTILVNELIQEPRAGSQANSTFHFVPGSGLSIGNHFYIATDITFTQSDNIDAAIKYTYGSGARLAAWSDLASDASRLGSQFFANYFLAGISLPVEGSVNCAYPNLFVSYQGNEFDSSRGRYFITNFTGGSLTNCQYTAFSNIDSRIFLGSYNWAGQALVYIPGAVYYPRVAASTTVIKP